MSVSETVRTLTELRHTPASPSLLRKVIAQQQSHSNVSSIIQHNTILQITRSSVDRSCATARSASQERGFVSGMPTVSGSTTSQVGQSNQGHAPGGVGQGFMAVLSAKLTNTASNNPASSSPKLLRKQIEQQSNKNIKTTSGFLETLNAKLAQQQVLHNTQGNSGTSRSATVRRIMGNRIPIMDPLQVRDSLMDQIRRGTSLRKTSGPINDRSAPKIY